MNQVEFEFREKMVTMYIPSNGPSMWGSANDIQKHGYGNEGNFWVSDMVESLRHDTGIAVDVGAGYGLYPNLWANFLSFNKIVAIEPLVVGHEAILANAPKAEIYDYYLGDGMSDTTTLDSMNLDNVSVIKIDVEGAEFSVMRGAEKTLSRDKPIIYLELHSNCPIEILDLIQDLGYSYATNNGSVTAEHFKSQWIRDQIQNVKLFGEMMNEQI